MLTSPLCHNSDVTFSQKQLSELQAGPSSLSAQACRPLVFALSFLHSSFFTMSGVRCSGLRGLRSQSATSLHDSAPVYVFALRGQDTGSALFWSLAVFFTKRNYDFSKNLIGKVTRKQQRSQGVKSSHCTCLGVTSSHLDQFQSRCCDCSALCFCSFAVVKLLS